MRGSGGLRLALLAILAVELCACASGPTDANQANPTFPIVYNESDRTVCPEQYDQISNTPELDARAAFRAGDRRIVGARSDGLIAPGVSDEEMASSFAEGTVGYRLIEGFHDAFDQGTCFRFIESATSYMERYNHEVIRLRDPSRVSTSPTATRN
jgi:hypothetical protein